MPRTNGGAGVVSTRGSGKLGRLIRRAAELAVAVFRHAAYTQTAMPLDLGKGEARLQGRAEIGSRKGWVGRDDLLSALVELVRAPQLGGQLCEDADSERRMTNPGRPAVAR